MISRHQVVSYGVALLAVAGVIAIRLLLDPLLGERLPFVTLYAAPAIAAWYGGRGPGLFAIAAGSVGTMYFIMPPRGSLVISQPEYQTGLIMFAIVGAALAILMGSLRKALEQSEEKSEQLRITLSSIGDGIITTDAAGRITDMNAVTEKLTGWTVEEARGRPLEEVFNIINEQTRQPVDNPAVRALSEGIIVGLANHTLLIARDGTERPIDDSAGPISRKDGTVVGCVLVFRDVTERHRQQRALEESEQQFRTLAESIPQLACIAHADGHIFWYNRRWYEYTGTDFAQMEGWGWQAVHHPDELPQVKARWQACIESGKPFDMVVPLKGKDGKYRPFLTRVVPIRNEKGAITRWFGTNTDISEQMRSEQEERAGRERLRMVLSTARMVAWQYNPSTGVVTTSDNANELFGIIHGSTSLASQQGLATIHPEDAEHHRRVVQEAIESSTGYQTQFRILRQDTGAVQWMEERGYLIPSETDQPAQMVGVTMDITERRQAEDALRERDATLHAFYDNSPVCMGVTEPTGDGDVLHLYDNPATCRFFGVAPGSTSNKLARAELGTDPAVLQRWIQHYQESEASGQPVHFEYAYHDVQGTRWLAATVCPIGLSPSGRTRFCYVAEDITERKRADMALRRQATIFENQTDAIIVTDLEGRILDWNPACERMLGYTKEEVLGRSPAMFHNNELALALKREALAAGRDGIWHGEIVFLRKDGMQGVCETVIKPLADEMGQVVGYVGVNRDITDRKGAEQRLRESEERFRTLAEGMPHCVWVCDSAGNNEFQNRAWYAYTGTPLGSGHGTSWLDQLHPEDQPYLLQEWNKAIQTEGVHPYDIEVRIRRHDGEYRWFRVMGSPIKSLRGATLRWVGTCSDIHEQRLLVQALQDADLRKNEFLATLAHELRNPLAPVRNALELMKRAAGDAQLIAQAQSTMERQIRQMVRLIDDLLDVSRITSNRLELRAERVELANIVRNAVETCRPLCEIARHQLTVSLPANPIYLHADPVRLAQVFGNLLTNACKYTEPGGRIWLGAETENVSVMVKVKDTGAGIPPEMQARVFDLFTQVDRTLERAAGGLGIGLSLVKRLVEMHGGNVKVYSEGPGRGSEFTVSLPILPDTTDARSSTQHEHSLPAFKTRRILIVDDNQDSAESLAMLLKLVGNETTTAHDGMQAVRMAAEFHPDVVLLDIGLPELNGYDACRRIRAQAGGEHIHLVALTGWGQENDRQKSADAGFDGHMVKPVELNELMKLLASLAPRQLGA